MTTTVTRAIRLAIVNLAGIPSVVYGLFGLGLFVLFLNFGTSIVAGALTLAIMTLPIIISTAEEALRAVPVEFRTVSASLGGTRWQGIRNIVLPQALPGIITGVILGLLRAAGETAPILFTVAAFYLPRLPRSPFDQTMALPYHLYVISTQVPGMPEQIQYGTALVLLVLVLSLNLLATCDPQLLRRQAPMVTMNDTQPRQNPFRPGLVLVWQQQVLKDVTLDVAANAVTVFLGPAGSGKSTLLRLINRLNDLLDDTRLAGQITIDGEDIYGRGLSVPQLRRRVGMVFALPLPLPGTIRENIIYGPRLAGVRDRARLEETVVRCLTQAALWDEVKDRLDQPSISLSGGQQQRLVHRSQSGA